MSAPLDMSVRNANIVLADEVIAGGIAVKAGTLSSVDTGASTHGEDFEGDYLVAGLVELHTDHLESHYAPRPGVRWHPIAALQAHDAQIASSGITTVFDALRVGSDAESRRLGTEMRTLADAIHQAKSAGRLRADHLLHLRCEISAADVVAGMTPFIGMPDLKLVSVMDHTPGQRQFVKLEKYREYYQGKTGMSDAEMDAFIAERLEAHETYAPAHRRAVVAMCRDAGIALASHDDATPAHVAEAVEDGVSISEFPTTMAAARAARDGGMSVLMGAPNVVRGGSHSGNVSAAELAAGCCLDILSSDYVPFSLLHAAFRLPQLVDGITLPRAVALVTRNPAAAVGLNDRGEIAPGKRADFVRVGYDGDVPVVRGVWRGGRRVA